MAPGTPGIKGAVTVKSSLETGQGEMQKAKKKSSMDPAMQLGKSLDSRRSSGTSKKSAPIIGGRGSAEALSPAEAPGALGPSHLRETETSADGNGNGTNTDDQNVRDLLWGP
jgi:autophagy-related protein 11